MHVNQLHMFYPCDSFVDFFFNCQDLKNKTYVTLSVDEHFLSSGLFKKSPIILF